VVLGAVVPDLSGRGPAAAKAAQTHPSVTFLGVAARDQVSAMTQFVSTHKMGGFIHLAEMDGSCGDTSASPSNRLSPSLQSTARRKPCRACCRSRPRRTA
jgi:hypothetical protein